MKKKIAIIIPGGVGSGIKGQGVPVLVDLIEQLALVYDLTVFTMVAIESNYQAKNFQLKSINAPHTRFLLFRFIQLFWLFTINHLKNNYQIIHAFWAFPSGWIAMIFGKIFRKKSVISLMGGSVINLPQINYGGQQKKRTRWLINQSLKQVNHLVTLTHYQRTFIPNLKINRPVEVIPLGINSTLFNYQSKTLKSPLKIIHIANCNPVKDQETLIKTFLLIQKETESTLQIIGPGFEGSKIQQLVETLKLEKQVTFSGFSSYKNVAKALKEADLLLHTSFFEGQALVVNEAMASGVLVCGTAVGLIADLSPLCCLTVPVSDYKALAKTVLELINSPAQMEKIRMMGFEWATKNDMKKTVEAYCSLYNRMLNE